MLPSLHIVTMYTDKKDKVMRRTEEFKTKPTGLLIMHKLVSNCRDESLCLKIEFILLDCCVAGNQDIAIDCHFLLHAVHQINSRFLIFTAK